MKKIFWIILAVMPVTLTASALDFFGVKLDQPIADVQAGMEKMGYKTDTISDRNIVMTKTVNSERRNLLYAKSQGDSVACMWTVSCPDAQYQDSVTLLLAAELTSLYGALDGIDWYDPRPDGCMGPLKSITGQDPYLFQMTWRKDNGLIMLTEYYESPYKVEMWFSQPCDEKDDVWRTPSTK